MKRPPHQLKSEKGFTVIELLIASMIFATVLLLVTMGLLQVSRTYYKGITSAKTQQTARGIIDQISQAIQFSGTSPSISPAAGPGATGYFCVNGTRYTYVLDRQLSDTPDTTKSQAAHVLVSDKTTGCSGPADFSNFGALSEAKELMSPNMRLAALSISPISGTKLYTINISVISGDNDLLASGNTKCTTSFAIGTEFCAVSTLNTTVQRRVN